MYFNNCRKRDHVRLYGSGAFFDLETSGYQAGVAGRLAKELGTGDKCIVATPDKIKDTSCDVTFDSYRFSGHAVMLDPDRSVSCHVYLGKLTDTKTMSRAEAIKHPVYSKFFNVKGHFKRLSVMRAQ